MKTWLTRIAVVLLLILSLLLFASGCVADPVDTLAVTDMWVTTINGAPYAPGVPFELDPIFTASDAFPITAADIANWNAMVPSQWTADATGINYQLGNVGIGTPSEASKRLIVFQNTGGPQNTGLEVNANNASAGGYGIYDSISGAKTNAAYGMYIYNSTSSGTNGIHTYGLRIRSDVSWIGVGSVNYALYINDPTGGSTANYSIYSAGGLNHLQGALTLGSPLVIGSGGTGQSTKVTAFDALSPMSNIGDIIYGGVAGTGTRLAGDTTNTRKFLRGLSVAGVGTAPVWDTLLATDIPSAYANLYEDGAGSNITIATAGTYYKWVTSTAGLYLLNTLSTANDNITVDTGGGGVYSVSFHASVATDHNLRLAHWAVFVDGVKQPQISSEAYTTSAAQQLLISTTGLVTLASGQVVDLRVSGDHDGEVVTVYHAGISMNRVAG